MRQVLHLLRAVAVAAVVLLAGACDDGAPRAVGTAPSEAATAPVVRPSTPPPQRSLEIVSPADGATVSAPVTLEVRVEGFSLTPIDGSFEQDSGHLYAFVDTPLPSEQVRIPEAPEIVRFAEPRVTLPELAPGRHTIGVIAAHGYPVPMMPLVTDQVTITVE